MNRIGNHFIRIVISTEIKTTRELCSDVHNICPHFLLEMNNEMKEKIQSIVAYNTSGLSGHLVLFNINERLMYCTQRYPSEQHLGMVWIDNNSKPILIDSISVQFNRKSTKFQWNMLWISKRRFAHLLGSHSDRCLGFPSVNWILDLVLD